MSRIAFAFAAVFAALSLGPGMCRAQAPAKPAGAPRPNIVHIVADDLG